MSLIPKVTVPEGLEQLFRTQFIRPPDEPLSCPARPTVQSRILHVEDVHSSNSRQKHCREEIVLEVKHDNLLMSLLKSH